MSLKPVLCALCITLCFLPFAQAAQTPAPTSLDAADTAHSAYLLGPGDQISLFVEDLPDEFTNKTFRIDTNGEVSLPVIGHLQVAGLSLARLESQCRDRLKHILKDPQVSVSLVNFGSQPISVLGAVNSPGIRQLEGSKTLFEVLSSAGGLRQDAGYEVKITRSLQRGPIPLQQAQTDPASQTSIAAVNLNDIIKATNPAENIQILPGDAISIPRAELVYVIGSVQRAGGFALNEHSSISALQAVSLAEGLQKTAASDRAKILREVPNSGARVEIAINLKRLMNGQSPDVKLLPNDILFVPNSSTKVAEQRTIDVLVGAAGAAIWRF